MSRITTTTRIALAATLGFVGACDSPYDGSGPAIDPNAPRVHIVTPERGSFVGGVASVTVTGTVTDDVGVTGVMVNDIPAVLDDNGGFTAIVPMAPGTKLIHAVATDADGNTGKETRAVVAGKLTPFDTMIHSGVTAAMSAETFDAIGKGASNFISTADLTALAAPMNPVVNAGGGPDCLYGQAFISKVQVSAATIKLQPVPGGIRLDATINNPQVGMHLQYAAACIDGSRDVSASLSKLHVTGLFAIGIDAQGGFDIKLRDPNVELTNFNVDLGGIPQDVIDLLDLDTKMGPILGWATERFVVPMLNKSLAGVNQPKSIEMMGKTIDVKLAPRRAEFDAVGGLLELDTKLVAQGATGSQGFVYIDNVIPQMDGSKGFQVAIADDTANQLLTSFWAAKGLDIGLDLANGSYGEIGKLYDRVEISAAVPPFVDASNSEALKLTLGDLAITFKNGGEVATKIIVNAAIGVNAAPGPDGLLRLDVGEPSVFVDVLDEGVEGANALSSAAFEEIASFALSRVVAVGSGSVGALPMPAAGGVKVDNVAIQQQAGYLVVDGTVH